MDIATSPHFEPSLSPPRTSRKKEAIMDALEDIVFGSVAGIAGKYIEYPFDTIKSLRTDGFLGIYRGISAPLVGAALETSSLFFWERIGRESLFLSGLYTREKPLPLSALWLTGAISGAFTSLVLTPVELVKCKIQVPLSTSGGAIQAPTPLSVMKEVYHHQGLRGFWNGQLGTLIRETGGCAAWFGSKETVTALFHRLNDTTPSSATLPLYQQALAGASAGMSYNFLFFPADTIKSRMQTSSVTGDGPKTTFWAEGKSIWKTSGLRGMYRGCGITVARSAPSSAFIFIIFDALKGKFGGAGAA